MYHVTVVDERQELQVEIEQMEIWKRREDFTLTEPIFTEEHAVEQMNRMGTDIVILAANGRSVDAIGLVERIRSNRVELRFVLVGSDRSYEQVRQVFRAGALDYVVRPLSEQMLDQALSRVYETAVTRETMYKITPKMELLVENLFSEDGADVSFICRNLIDTIYEDFDRDVLSAQMTADKSKERIYQELVRRKPWLEKFLHADQYTYRIGFKNQGRETIVRQWIRDFTRVGCVIHKYHMVDHKLVYPIGKYIVVHVDERLNLERISKDVFLSKNYISNIFKKYVGMSVVEFVKEVKVDRAKILLLDQTRKVREISEQLNYPDAEYFAKIFKQKTGETPTEYRRQ
ncbi:DNA-binding response regulator [Ethanoligenens harbinense]|uniref:response regulator transcription factor n=1 Tax=Ethanoligenens harbinense TaxID=253239 RepID=UPI0013C4206D|nr:DNA-binding response regulator [Ethanoligenens harbinense]